jgi:iron complex outermembrane receptor protein
MKKIYFLGVLIQLSFISVAQQQQSLSDTNFLQPIEINAVRASDALPVAKTNLTKQDIAKQNVGYDLPFILNQTPSIQVNADAGNGIGYTGFRIRGTDASRINITINGIPYNDAESQGTFLVNLPDMASSAQSRSWTSVQLVK